MMPWIMRGVAGWTAVALIGLITLSADSSSTAVSASIPRDVASARSAEPEGETELIAGKLVMVGENALVALVNGEERRFRVSPTAEIRKDGTEVLLASLSRHDVLSMSGRRSEGDVLVGRIDARSAY